MVYFLYLFILLFISAEIAAYVIYGKRQVEALRKSNDEKSRRHFFLKKIKLQAICIGVFPLLSLIILNYEGTSSSYFWSSLAEWQRPLSDFLGFTKRELLELPLYTFVIEVAVLIFAIEAIQTVRKDKGKLYLGDVSIIIPRNRAELKYCLVMSIIAGTGEEIAFRFVLPCALVGIGIPFHYALVLSILFFGVCHIYQGVIGVISTALAGALIATLFVLSGSLVLAICLHIAINSIGLVIRPAVGMVITRFSQRFF